MSTTTQPLESTGSPAVEPAPRARRLRWLAAETSVARAAFCGLASADTEARPYDIWVELETAGGQTVRLPLSQFGAIHPPLPAQILKAGWVEPVLGFDKIAVETPFERVLQTYLLPLSAFQAADPAFRPDQLAAVRFIFDGDQGGAVYIDDIGFLGVQ